MHFIAQSLIEFFETISIILIFFSVKQNWIFRSSYRTITLYATYCTIHLYLRKNYCFYSKFHLLHTMEKYYNAPQLCFSIIVREKIMIINSDHRNSILPHSIVRNEVTTMCWIKAPFQPCISNSCLSVLCNIQCVFNTNNKFIGAHCIYTK